MNLLSEIHAFFFCDDRQDALEQNICNRWHTWSLYRKALLFVSQSNTRWRCLRTVFGFGWLKNGKYQIPSTPSKQNVCFFEHQNKEVKI